MTPAQVSEGLALTELRDREHQFKTSLIQRLVNDVEVLVCLLGQWQIVACSALTGKGLMDGMDWIA